MKQWRAAKQAHPGTLLLFRMGDFYETFEEDAKIASRVLGIALTKRAGKGAAKGSAQDMPLAGFPYHALDSYLHKLLSAGLRVAICEQVEDPKQAQGLVRREVTEVVTPGTALSEQFLDRNENNYLAAVLFDGEQAGLALLDHSTGEFQASQFGRSDCDELLNRYRPSEILVPESQHNDIRYLLGSLSALVTEYPDWVADIDNASSELTRQFGTRSLKGFGLEAMPLAIGAAGAVLHYLEQNQPGRKAHITGLKTMTTGEHLVLDNFTVRNLEIFTSLATQGQHGTLLSVIDHTRTAPGARLLKQWLRSPLQLPGDINARLDRVEALVSSADLREDIAGHLSTVSDLERILGRMATGRATPRDAVNLAQSLDSLEQIAALVKAAGDKPLMRLLKQREPSGPVMKLIGDALVDDPPAQLGRGEVMRSSHNAELDELRSLTGSGKEWISRLQQSERERTGIPSLKIGFNNVFGYYLEVTRTHQDKVPDNYIRKQTLVNAERYITPELKEQEEKILSAEESLDALEKELFAQLIADVIESTAAIQTNASVLAQLDIAAGLAETAVRHNHVRPAFEKGKGLSISGGRHPVVETLLPEGEAFTPNDLHMDPADSQIHIITGPNMAGKSTYLRQVGLIVVMAHMGSFVPADAATMGIVDRLFTRVGASDNLAGGESTFLVEMVETANILNNATDRSLILLDEIGRGTSTYDGLSIAWAVTEYLHQHSEVAGKTLFATHFHELVALADSLPRVRNFNVAVREHGHEVVFLRKIVPGGADRSYGIHVAQMAGLPKWITRRAGEILAGLTREKGGPTPPPPSEPDAQVDLFGAREARLAKEFQEVKVENLTPIEALNLLDRLKKKHGL